MTEETPRYLTGYPPLASLAGRLSGPRSRAWDITERAYELERGGAQIIHLGVGDPDFDTPAAITDAAVSSLRAGRTHYSPISGEFSLRETIATVNSGKFGADINASQTCIFPGAQCALFAVMMLLTDPGDEVILLEPFYATYEGVARASGASLVSVPLDAERGFSLNMERLSAAITGRTRVILANSPGNPSGTVFSLDDWSKLADLCVRNDIWLVSDEVYSDFVYDGEPYSALSMDEARQNVVVVNSISKSHAMTGWRLGWTIAPDPLANELSNLAQFLLFGVSQFTQDAACFALRECDAEVARLREAFRNRRNLFCNELQKIDGIVVHRPAGGMFAMIDVSGLGCDGEQFAARLLDEAGVAVVPGFAFGDSVTNYLRIGFLVDEAALQLAAHKIRDFVNSNFL